MWINRHKGNNSLAVLVHGIFGNDLTTWSGFLRVIQQGAVMLPEVRSWDVYSLGYATNAISQPPLDPFAVSVLRNFLLGVRERYETIALVAHSQGGLVSKLYVVEEIEQGRANQLRTDLVVTFGTPHRGYAALRPIRGAAAVLGRVPLLGARHPLRQLGDLASTSPVFEKLKRSWTRERLETPELRRPIRSVAVTGAFDAAVNADRSGGFPGVDERQNIRANHRLMVKPGSVRDEQADVLFRLLRQHLEPTDILQRIIRIRTQGGMRSYMQPLLSRVQDLVLAARPGVSARALEAKIGSLLVDFLYDFPERPLRGLEFEDAALEFARRSLVTQPAGLHWPTP